MKTRVPAAEGSFENPPCRTSMSFLPATAQGAMKASRDFASRRRVTFKESNRLFSFASTDKESNRPSAKCVSASLLVGAFSA